MSETTLQKLADKVNALTPPDRLRFAAGLMEQRCSGVALPIIRRVADELELALLLREGKDKA